MADRSQVSLLDSDPDPPPELPEPGSIRDKIALFSANSTANGLSDRPKTATESLPDISRQKSPQQLAAEIAVGNSPAPSSKPTPVEVHRAQSHRNETSPNRDLPSPIPIRRTVVSPRLLEPSSNGLHGTSLPNSQSELRPVSPRVPTSPRPRITKPRPAPPVPRKPSPVFHEPIPNEHNSEPSLLPSFPLRSKASASTLSSERGPPLPPRRAATLPVKDAQEQQLISGRTKSPAWPSSPSTVSIYSQSQNPSSSSMIDNLTDVSKDGPSDAVAASSLASNRARQARKPSPPPPPPQRRRRSRSRSLLHLQHQAKKDRAPSPSPGSLQKTLRTQAKSDGEDESRYRRQHRNRIINKHPHKHQEGDRRRWRSEVTEKERKRYEGVWAANKGLLIPTNQVFTRRAPAQEVPPDMYPPAALEMVVNLVVQDIWSRSRLPAHVLEQIWDLVDRQKIGLLTRPEFVVGMWLIDQQLRGHKLPAEVPDSVWASVVRVPGISLDDLQYAK
ncbi:hypothetical protein BJY04DRAFT_175997 [Aspergillus karnatakaensis]|uniref:protein irs4 n=1 Tax=Aspergillus karnatakaensis TaxID=1810916 RepID=UPI003CCCA615